MTLTQMQYIVESARYGSINKAAQTLFVSQSAISLAIANVEEEFNIKLFHRSNHGITPTAEGQEFIRHAESILLQTKQLGEILRVGQPQVSYRLHISTQRFPFATEAFLQYFETISPDAHYQFSVKETNMYKVINDVYDQRSDIGVIFLSDLTKDYIARVLRSKSMEFHKLVDILPHVFLRRAHPLAEKGELSVEDLSNYPYVAFDQDSNISLDYAEDVRLLGFSRSDHIIEVHERATAINILANTNAFAIGTGMLVSRLGDERVIAIPILDAQNHMAPGWIKRRDTPMSEELESYVRILETVALD